MIKSRLLSLPFICFLLSFPVIIIGQEETAIRTIIEEGDIKKLLKADEMTKDADLRVEEASRLNMEVFTVQADINLDEKSIPGRQVNWRNRHCRNRLRLPDFMKKPTR